MKAITEIKGLTTINGLGVKVSKKYILIVDCNENDKALGFKRITWCGTNNIKTAEANLRSALRSSVLSPLNPEIAINN